MRNSWLLLIFIIFVFVINPKFSLISSQSSRHSRLHLHLQLLAISIQDHGSSCHLTQQQAKPHKPQEKSEERGRLEGGGEKVSRLVIMYIPMQPV